MKWLKILLMLTALLSSGFAVADSKSICEVRDEARQGTFNGSLDDISTFKVCKSNTGAKAIYYLASSYFEDDETVKLIARWLDFDSSKLPKQSFDIVSMLVAIFVSLASSIAAFLVILKLVRTLGQLMQENQGVGDLILENKKLVISYLLLALFVSPLLIVPLAVFLAFIPIASNNYVADGSQLYSLKELASDMESQKPLEEEKTLSFYETSESAISRIAVKEFQTRNALLTVKAGEIQKGGWDQWESSTLTKGDVLRIIENDIKLVFTPNYQNNKFTGVDISWNGNFKEHDDRAFGPANFLETISLKNLSNVENSGIKEDEITEALKLQGFKDGQEFMPTDKLFNSVQKYKNIIYQSVNEGRGNGYRKYYDSQLVNEISSFLTGKINSIKNDLLLQGIKEIDTTKYLSVYFASVVDSIRGVNPAATYAGKYKSLGGFGVAVQAVTCSKNYEKHQFLRDNIAKFNAIPDSTPFSDTKVWMSAVGLDMSCAMIKEGRIVYTGFDLKDNATLEKSIIATTYAEAEAGNLYDSQVIQGVLDSANNIVLSVEGLKLSILSNTGVGPAGVAKNIKSYSVINGQRNLIDMAVYNSVSVSYSSIGENDRYLDYTKLSNQTNFDLYKQSEGYKSLTLENRTIPMVEAFIGGLKSNGSLNSNNIANSETSSSGFFDDIIAKIQNQFTAVNQFKKFLGMDETKSFESGIEECERTDNCERRKYGTSGDLFAMGPSLMNVGTTIIAMAATADALEAVKDMSKALSLVGIDGSKGWGKMLAGGIDLFGGKAVGVIIDLIQIITSLLKPLGWLLFFVGIFIGYWLPILPLLMAYMLDITIALMFITFITMFPVFVILGHLTNSSQHYIEMAKTTAAEVAEKIVRGTGITISINLLCYFPIGYFVYEPFSVIYTQGIFAPLIAISVAMLFGAALVMAIIRYSDKLTEFTSGVLGRASITANSEASSAEQMVIAGTTMDIVRQAAQNAVNVPAEQIKKNTEKLKANNQSDIEQMSESRPSSQNMQGSKE